MTQYSDHLWFGNHTLSHDRTISIVIFKTNNHPQKSSTQNLSAMLRFVIIGVGSESQEEIPTRASKVMK